MITEDVIALDSVLWKLHCSAIKTISALIKWYTLFTLCLKVHIFSYRFIVFKLYCNIINYDIHFTAVEGF